jgi:hypothetical protein
MDRMARVVKLVLLSSLLVMPLGVLGQDVLAPIPTSWKADLSNRLNLLIEVRRSQRWEEFSDLLSLESKHGRSKEQIIENYREFPGAMGTDRSLIAFVPQTTKVRDAAKAVWLIYGCAQLNGLKVPVDAFVVAKRENGNWYFSDIDGLTPRDSEWHSCAYEKRSRARSRVSDSDR